MKIDRVEDGHGVIRAKGDLRPITTWKTQKHHPKGLDKKPDLGYCIVVATGIGKSVSCIIGGEQGSTGQVEVEVACPGCQEAW